MAGGALPSYDQCRPIAMRKLGSSPCAAVELDHVHGELEIDQSARQQFRVERAERGFVQPPSRRASRSPRRSTSRCRSVAAQHGVCHHRLETAARAASERIDRSRAGERHMLPGPRTLALIEREAVERDAKRPLRPRRPQPRVDLVERPRRGRHRQRSADPLRQAIVIQHRAERFGAIRFGQIIAGEDDRPGRGPTRASTHPRPSARARG